jgi:hypothetical protein
VPGITGALLIISIRHNRCTLLPIPSLGIWSFWWGRGGPSAVTGAIPLPEMAIPSVTEPGILPIGQIYHGIRRIIFPFGRFIQQVKPYLHTFPPEAEFLDEIQTKVLRVFFLAIQNHLALRFLFLQNHATSFSFYRALLYTVKEKGGKPDIKPHPLYGYFRKIIFGLGFEFFQKVKKSNRCTLIC